MDNKVIKINGQKNANHAQELIVSGHEALKEEEIAT
jgi:hypothetical protein